MIDVRGLSCPEPVIILKKAMGSHEAAYEVTADSMTCVENITRYAQHEGYSVEARQDGDDYIISITK